MHRNKIKLRIITPQKIVADVYCRSLLMPGEAGNFQLLSNHENLISKLKAGMIYIKDADYLQSFLVSQSFMKFKQNTCDVIAEYAIAISDAKAFSKKDIISKIESSSFGSEKQFYECMLKHNVF